MTIAASFIYSMAKRVMLGSSTGTGSETLPSLSLTSSVKAFFVLESHTPDPTASTTAAWRTVFSSRAVYGDTVGHVSHTGDIVLAPTVISTSTDGTIALDDTTETPTTAGSVSAGQSIGGICIYKWAGTHNTSFPVALIDLGSPITANGASINVNWDNSKLRIFALT